MTPPSKARAVLTPAHTEVIHVRLMMGYPGAMDWRTDMTDLLDSHEALVAERDRAAEAAEGFRQERDDHKARAVRLEGRNAELLGLLREAGDNFEEIRNSLPYPHDYRGQKVEGGEWSVPPSTARHLRDIVGSRIQPSDFLAAIDAALGEGEQG